MKKITFFIVMAIVAVTTFSSCKKENNRPQTSGNIGIGVGPVYIQFNWGNSNNPNYYYPVNGYYYGNGNEEYFVGYIDHAPGGVDAQGNVSVDVLVNILASNGKPLFNTITKKPVIVDCKTMFYKSAERFLLIANSVSYPLGTLRPVSIHRTGTDYAIYI